MTAIEQLVKRNSGLWVKQSHASMYVSSDARIAVSFTNQFHSRRLKYSLLSNHKHPGGQASEAV